MDKTRLRLLFVLVGLVCALPAFSQEKNTTFWIGGPLMVEFRPDQTSTFTIGAGFAPVTVEEEDFFGTTQVIEFGFSIFSCRSYTRQAAPSI